MRQIFTQIHSFLTNYKSSEESKVGWTPCNSLEGHVANVASREEEAKHNWGTKPENAILKVNLAKAASLSLQ